MEKEIGDIEDFAASRKWDWDPTRSRVWQREILFFEKGQVAQLQAMEWVTDSLQPLTISGSVSALQLKSFLSEDRGRQSSQ